MTTTLNYTAAHDCWVDKFDNFDDTDTVLYIGESVNDLDRNPRDWWLFQNINVPKNYVVISATLTLTASHTSATTGSITVSCEDTTSPASPANGADLNGRTATGGNTLTLEAYTAGNTYGYDVTAAVQNVVNRSDWANLSHLAVMADDDATAKIHRVYSARNGSGIATLQIVVPDFIPRGGMW